MNFEHIIECLQSTLIQMLLIGGPILLIALVTGVVSGILQAVTQVHDHAVSFVPKLLVLLTSLVFLLPWLVERMLEFSQRAFSGSLGSF